MDQNNEICQKCKERYKPEKGKCIEWQDKNCLRCDDDKAICTQCYSSTFLGDGKCFEPNKF